MEVNLTTEKARRDYKLVCLAREQGDQKAFTLLMNTYREPLYMMLLKMTNSPVDADDLTVETFGKAFNQLDMYSPTNAFSTWLFSIGANNCIDFIRKKKISTISINELSRVSEDEVYEFPLPSSSPNPEEAFISSQRKELLHVFVEKLKPHYRELIKCRYFDELSYEEIAQKTNLPMGTVKIRLMRAKQHLLRMFNDRKEEVV